jgi:hypothetical protein
MAQSGGGESAYIWGAALDEFGRMQPSARIINLETRWHGACTNQTLSGNAAHHRFCTR